MKFPNILWILTDQQSANMMSCIGNKFVRTPNMDYIARKGVIFENTYCTNPVCLPSRFSLFTGLYPGDVGFKSNEYRKETDGLPDFIVENGLGKLLKEKGYTAVYGGKEHLPFLNAEALGFDYICSDEREVLAENLSEFIRNYSNNTPFAMVASFINPHDICLMAIDDFADEAGDGTKEYFRTYFKEAINNIKAYEKIPHGMHPDVFFECVCPPLPANHLPAEDEPEAITILQEDRNFKKLAREHYSDERWRMHRWIYAKLTEQVDKQIGKVLTALIDSGLWDNTVIIFTSDHGDMDASHKMEHKTALYQECCKVPLIVKGIDDSFVNKRFPQLVSNGLDCICTVMDYAGIAQPNYLSGRSLKPLIEKKDSQLYEIRDKESAVDKRGVEGQDFGIDWRKKLVIESEYGIAVIKETYKYTQYFCGEKREQFYDLRINQGEQYNQIEDEKYHGVIKELRDTANAYLKRRQKA